MELTVERRRIAFIALLVVAGLAFLVALGATLAASANAGAWLIGSVVVIGLALAGELVLLVWGEQRRFDEAGGEWYDWEKEGKRAEELLLRCPSCKQTFSLLDTGERPLRHSCPHCGRAGVLREPRAPARVERAG